MTPRTTVFFRTTSAAFSPRKSTISDIISLPASTNAILTIGIIRINVSAFQAAYSPKGLIILTSA